MRIIAGKARSMPLKTLPGFSTRPTSDKIKETLFNMLSFDIAGSRFLDLFSGSGAIGLEALSRGAAEAVFVENSRQACEIIKQNIEFTKLCGTENVLCMDVIRALDFLRKENPYDFIFADPPYSAEYEKPLLSALSDNPVADEYTTVIIEADIHTDFSFCEGYGFEIKREKKYKNNKHVFLQRMESK